MDEYQDKQGSLIDITDCLEAVGVLRGWKNFLFIVVILCLFLLQACFWAVNTGHVKTGDKADNATSAVFWEGTNAGTENEAHRAGLFVLAAVKSAEDGKKSQEQVVGEEDEIRAAAKKVAGDANEPTEAAPEKPKRRHFAITFENLDLAMRCFNFVLVLAAALYCLTMLFILKVSLLGRLGGVNHICRAFFLSLVMVVLLLPWQKFFGGVVSGAMFTADELSKSFEAVKAGEMSDKIFYYLRYTVYWLLVLLLLILSYVRSCRWARATLRRLEAV